MFWKYYVTDSGYVLTFKSVDDANLQLSKYGEYLYKHLIIFAPTVKEFGGALSMGAITVFIDDGRNVLIAGSSQSAGDALHELASECGLEINEEGSTVIDHMNYDVSDNGQHTTIIADPANPIDAPVIVGSKDIPSVTLSGNWADCGFG
ncbi:unnamed protein product [Lasius platythorax]|uniref:Dolichyl-diphosphooligosaccharide--protein glycosyltransferase 48 kDa subunit n=2 Tax=Lasius TaxID=488720 RepID=A0A0J7L890_LASNI|nr:dolichyl-diphosphooligosaccharide--protein glycosyltransferase 48 kda subunit [Lasius niger]KMR01320.1 dolichyl-diphosphooligosaccharide--protein glycosyltransferase 48 kda subunit [Lasius niger]